MVRGVIRLGRIGGRFTDYSWPIPFGAAGRERIPKVIRSDHAGARPTARARTEPLRFGGSEAVRGLIRLGQIGGRFTDYSRPIPFGAAGRERIPKAIRSDHAGARPTARARTKSLRFGGLEAVRRVNRSGRTGGRFTDVSLPIPLGVAGWERIPKVIRSERAGARPTNRAWPKPLRSWWAESARMVIRFGRAGGRFTDGAWPNLVRKKRCGVRRACDSPRRRRRVHPPTSDGRIPYDEEDRKLFDGVIRLGRFRNDSPTVRGGLPLARPQGNGSPRRFVPTAPASPRGRGGGFPMAGRIGMGRRVIRSFHAGWTLRGPRSPNSLSARRIGKSPRSDSHGRDGGCSADVACRSRHRRGGSGTRSKGESFQPRR